MRLTNINCPQCNGRLNQQEDKFYCTSCGSAFNIDYDEADVEYAKLVTEPERTRLLLDNNRILLEKNEELRNKFITGERKKEFVHTVKRHGMTHLGAVAYAAIIGGMSFLLCVIAVAAIFFGVWRRSKAESAEREQARIESIENLSAEDIENDRNFLENAIAGGAAYEIAKRDDPVRNDAADGGDAYMTGSPVAVECCLLKNGSENNLCIVYKITYEFSENNTLKEVYDCVIFGDIKLDETDHISFGYDCDRISGGRKDDHWDGYENAEDIYDDDKIFEEFDLFDIDI